MAWAGEHRRPVGMVERFGARPMKLGTHEACGDNSWLGLWRLLRLRWLGLRLGFWLGLQCLLRFRQRFNLGLRLGLVCLGRRGLLRPPLYYQFVANHAQEFHRIRTSHLLSKSNDDNCQLYARQTKPRSFPHLEFITPRSNLGVWSWLSVGVVEDLGDGLHLNILRMFLHWLSS